MSGIRISPNVDGYDYDYGDDDGDDDDDYADADSAAWYRWLCAQKYSAYGDYGKKDNDNQSCCTETTGHHN